MTAVALFFSTFAETDHGDSADAGDSGWPDISTPTFAISRRSSNSPVAAWLARGLYYVLPNLAPFDVKAEVVHGLPVSASHVSLTVAYAFVYIAMLLLAAMAVFRRRDFK